MRSGMLDPSHRRFVHELGWQLRWGDAGAIIAIKPWWMGPDSRPVRIRATSSLLNRGAAEITAAGHLGP